MRTYAIFALLFALILAPPLMAKELDERLIDAAQNERIEEVKSLLEEGANIDAANRYGATPLFFAVDKGNLELVRFLLEKGATVDVTATFYGATPLAWATSNLRESEETRQVVLLLLANTPADAAIIFPIAQQMGDLELLRATVETGKVEAGDLRQALEQAQEAGNQEIAEYLKPKVTAEEEKVVAEATDAPQLGAEELKSYHGQFSNDQIDMKISIFGEGDEIKAQAEGQPAFKLVPEGDDIFVGQGVPVRLSFSGRGGTIERFQLEQGSQEFTFTRFEATTEVETVSELPELPAVEAGPAKPWPSFRGRNADGIGDAQGAVATWKGEAGENVRWKTAIPGIALSSPVVWDGRVYVTAAYSKAGDDTFRTGLYGDVDSVEDDSEHLWQVYALDLQSGEILWKKDATRGVPQVKRHLKSSHANPTPVTDGERVIAHFGSEGLFAYSKDGELLWKQSLGRLDSGWFFDPSYQWGFASSPVLHDGKVIVQTDIHEGSFIAAFDVKTGEELWRTARKEIPTWGTPGILPPKEAGGPFEVITNGTTIRGYDASSGEELWSLAPNSEVTVGTPIVADGMAIVTGGYPPVRPIYAIRPGSRGDISLADDASSNEAVAWSVKPGGTYMPTPIAYRGLLYMLNNNGRLAAYDVKTGERVYRKRVGRGATSFSGSPVAADGRLFLTTEEGDTHVIRAGRDYEHLGINELGEVVMTTPAISDGVIVMRGMKHVYGLARPMDTENPAEPETKDGAAQ